LGEGGRYIPICRSGNFIGIGFGEIPNLSSWESRDYHDDATWPAFKDFFANHFEATSPVQLGIQAAQVWKFVLEFMPGDLIAVPNTPEESVLIGEVTSGYHFVTNPTDGCHYQHRREAKWIDELPRTDVSEPLKTSLRSFLTVFSIKKHREEMEVLSGNEAAPHEEVVVTGADLTAKIVDRLYHMDAGRFEDLVANLLQTFGFDTVPTGRTGDGGIDVIGSLDAYGLAAVSLHVQVKRRRGKASAGEIRDLRGTLGQGDQGVFFSLGGFTPQAAQEAEAPGRPAVRTISGAALADMILSRYDHLSEEFKTFLGLEKRDLPISEKFMMRT
jgi:restriction system protein